MNKKIFLAPNSIKSMAAAHAKIYKDKKEYVLRISDCHNTIKLWGKIDNKDDLQEGINKLQNLIDLAAELKQELEGQLKQIEGENKEFKYLTYKTTKELIDNYGYLEILSNKNKVPITTIVTWIENCHPEILKPYNINLIAELLKIKPHEVWE